MISAEQFQKTQNLSEADILANQRKGRSEFVKPEMVKRADAKLQEVDSQIVDVSRNLNAVRESQKANIQTLNDLKSKIDNPDIPVENKQQLIDIYNQTLASAQETEATEKQVFDKATALQRSKATLKKVYDVQQNLDMNSNDDIVRGTGNFLSHVYNATIPSVVGGTGALIESAGDVGAVGPGNAVYEMLGLPKEFIENKLTDILGDGLQAAGKDMGTEIDQKYSDKHYVTSMAGDIAGSIVSTALPAGALGKAGKVAQLLSGVTAGTMQMADGVYKKAKEAGLSDADAGAMTLTIAPVSGLLEMWGASNIVDNIVGKKLINELVSESTKKLAGQQITKQLIFETVGDTFKTLGQKYGKNLLVSAGEEGLTEGLQGEVEAAAENIYDVTQDKPAYGTEFFSSKTQLDVAKQAAIGALAGGPMGLLSGISTPKNIYDKAVELKSDPHKLAQFQEMLNTEVQAQNITPEQAQNITDNIGAMIATDEKVPSVVTDKNKRFEAVELIKEKSALMKEASGLDVAMAAPTMDRINQINSELELIARGAERTNLERKPFNTQADAVQEQSASSVLQHSQEGAGITGSERGPLEQGVQGDEATKKAEIQKAQEGLTPAQSKKQASIMFAPFYDFNVKSAEDADRVRKSPAYKQYVNNIRVIAHNLGVKITGIDDNIGGFRNQEGKGDRVTEVSNRLDIEVDNFEQAEQMAALLGALSPEAQESAIAAEYVSDNSENHNAYDYVLDIDDIPKTLAALKAAGVDGYSINEKNKTLTITDAFDAHDLDFDDKLAILAEKLKEKGVKYGESRKRATRSSYIDAGAREKILGNMGETLRGSEVGRKQSGSNLHNIVTEAQRKNERFRAEQGVEKERIAREDLRSKQLKLQEEGKDLSAEELAEMESLDKKLKPVLESAIKSEEQNYENAKEEVESLGATAVGKKGFVLPFGIKNPIRAAQKILDWYQGKPNKLGDGARTNIIVNDIKDADEIFDIIKKNYEGGDMREEKGNGKGNPLTDYGYPKRLLEVRTKNGRVAEFQVMEPLAYIAKDGIKEYKEADKKAEAKQQLADLQEKIGEKIPDGAGHWFYEIGRDTKMPKEIVAAAKDISKTYYEAFTNPEKYLKGPRDFSAKLKAFNEMVENADRSKWNKDHLKNRPDSVTDALGGKTTGISKEARAQQRKELGIEDLSENLGKGIPTQTWEELNKEANRLVDSGEIDFNKFAQEIIAGDRITDPLGKAILNRGAVEVGNKIIDARDAKNKAKANGDLAKYDKANDEELQAIVDLGNIQSALKNEGKLAGQNLAAMKMAMRDDYSVGKLYSDFKTANGDKPVPREVVEEFSEQSAKIDELTTKLNAADELIASLQSKVADAKNQKPISVKEKVKQVREKRSKLLDDWKKYRDEQNKPKGPDEPTIVQAGGIGVKWTNEDFKFLGQLVSSYIEEGILTTSDLAKRLKSDVKKSLGVKISEEDIYNVLNTEVDGKKPIDDFENNGLVGDIEKTKERLELLRSNLKDTDKYFKALDEAKAAREKKETYKSEELKDLEKEVRQAALDLRIEREKVKKKIRNQVSAIEFANRSKSEKIKEGVANILNVPRSLMASFDFSAPLRQGLVATVAHPGSGLKATAEMFKQVFSQKNFDEWLIKYKLSPDWELAKKSELYVADPSEFTLNGKEEAFMSNLAERIPIVGRFIKGSERAYVGYLNKLRTDVFKNGAELLMKDGKTFEKNEKEFKALADFINSSTGRGKLPNKTIEDAAPLLNAAFFSPRLIASRVNLLNPVYYAKMPPSVRRMAVKDMAKFAGFASAVLLMASAAGADVEKDPRSSDFAKIKIGNTRYDILGGFQQYIKLAAEMITGQKKTEKGIIDFDKPNWQQQTRGSELLKFARQKLSPSVGMAVDFLTGTKTTGDKAKFNELLSWDNEWVEHLTPLQLQSAMEAYKAGGWGKVFSTMIPSMFGIGVQTYSNAKKNKELEKAFKEFRRMPKD
jgi:hypothetical protein